MSTTIIDHALKSLVGTGRVIIARYREDCPRSERPPITIAHPGCAWAACSPIKRPPFSWWNVQMHCIWRQCCILTNFRFVIKSMCFVFQALIYFYSGNTLCNELIYRHHIQFTGIEQLHIPDISIKIYANRMSASSWFLCLKNGHYFCMHRLAHKRTQWPTPVREITKSSSTFSATNISSNIVWLLQLHDTIQMESFFCYQIQ